MIKGSCLCQGVSFEIKSLDGPFEHCHCNRCRKVTGSSSMPGISVRLENFKYLSGQNLIKTYEAPILSSPPTYRSAFCSVCGSPAPLPYQNRPSIEIPAGLIDDEINIQPDRHIFVEHLPNWDTISDGLPQWTRKDVLLNRGLTE